MFKENTGTHLLDSGGAYGRNWERNQGRDLNKIPEAIGEFSISSGKLEVSVTIDAYHWLLERLWYDADMQRKFKRFCDRAKNRDSRYLELMEEFPNFMKERGHRVSNVYTVNTYNGECALSQTLQFTTFDLDSVEYVLLQVHGGCDVRGGYTAPVVFQTREGDGLYGFADCSLFAECDGKRDGYWWRSDTGGYDWQPEEFSTELPLFGERGWALTPKLDSFPVTNDESLLGDGLHLVVTSDGKAFLPNGCELRVSP
jgi:hypothetical protein